MELTYDQMDNKLNALNDYYPVKDIQQNVFENVVQAEVELLEKNGELEYELIDEKRRITSRWGDVDSPQEFLEPSDIENKLAELRDSYKNILYDQSIVEEMDGIKTTKGDNMSKLENPTQEHSQKYQVSHTSAGDVVIEQFDKLYDRSLEEFIKAYEKVDISNKYDIADFLNSEHVITDDNRSYCVEINREGAVFGIKLIEDPSEKVDIKDERVAQHLESLSVAMRHECQPYYEYLSQEYEHQISADNEQVNEHSFRL